MKDLGTVHPKHQVVPIGEDTLVSCFSAVEPRWVKNGRILRVITLFNTLKFTNITEEDGGVYTCRGYLDERGTREFEAKANLLVGGNCYVTK